ncbi:Restriction endonuclease [Elusimicrobium minutum Pei191]|uniref:Restriction endonuclease n=1 Tax=Elusimicrobium minutum (strain Pei191) TaxID=445932 RepID=B2KD14_ELUMP|nr:HNH endonuclease [Elusimicrobium minutum]ACC98410.1 Restriction endonuclease [Elusimicrobium minutum Pei191]
MNYGDIISYLQMCTEEQISLQRGMYFRLNNKYSIFLMSVRTGAPYHDLFEENGRILIYEGHDIPKTKDLKKNPKELDQPQYTENGKLTQNGKFYKAAIDYKNNLNEPEVVKIYEKIKDGIWSYTGFFKLVDAWTQKSNKRSVFKFKLEIIDEPTNSKTLKKEIIHSRLIPTIVKRHVWERDKGQCVQCGNKTNLHFDHNIPFSKGGSSITAKNIQLLCAKCNLSKHDKII